MNEEFDCNFMTEANIVEWPITNFTRKERKTPIKAKKTGKAAGLYKICAEMIFTSIEVGIGVIMEFGQHVAKKKCRMNGKRLCWCQFSKKKEM